jgi:hypothetical protein
MVLHRPTFRLWPSISAVFFSYLIAGAVYGAATTIQIVTAPSHSSFDRISMTLMFAFMGAGSTIISAGMPYLDKQTPTNLYPAIVPMMAVLLTVTSGAVRVVSNPRRYLLWALVAGLLLMAAGLIDGIYHFRNCGPYKCE